MVGMLHPFVVTPISCVFGYVKELLAYLFRWLNSFINFQLSERVKRLFTYSTVLYLATVVLIQLPLRQAAFENMISDIASNVSLLEHKDLLDYGLFDRCHVINRTSIDLYSKDFSFLNVFSFKGRSDILLFMTLFLVVIHVANAFILNIQPPLPMKSFFLGQLDQKSKPSSKENLETLLSNEQTTMGFQNEMSKIKQLRWKYLFFTLITVIWVIILIYSPRFYFLFKKF